MCDAFLYSVYQCLCCNNLSPLCASSLFADVINCMQTDNLELKKLVYLYLMNYAKSQPDLAILAVNTFSKDCEDSNPLIRALAVRTMGCIRVDKITEYLCEPLRKCLKVLLFHHPEYFFTGHFFSRMKILMCVRQLLCVWPSCTISIPSWLRTKAFWIS